MDPAAPAFVDPRRKELPYSRVTVFNSSSVQTHVVIDRHSIGHTLLPGQRVRDVELTNEDMLRRKTARSHCPYASFWLSTDFAERIFVPGLSMERRTVSPA
jgi:hypothetical protein